MHMQLVTYLWPKMVQKSLDKLRDQLNNHRSRKNNRKLLPSGCSADEAYSLYAQYGGEWCLQPVDVDVIDIIIETLFHGQNPLDDWGIPMEFETRAARALEHLGMEHDDIHLDNVWYVFSAMLPLLE